MAPSLARSKRPCGGEARRTLHRSGRLPDARRNLNSPSRSFHPSTCGRGPRSTGVLFRRRASGAPLCRATRAAPYAWVDTGLTRDCRVCGRVCLLHSLVHVPTPGSQTRAKGALDAVIVLRALETIKRESRMLDDHCERISWAWEPTVQNPLLHRRLELPSQARHKSVILSM